MAFGSDSDSNAEKLEDTNQNIEDDEILSKPGPSKSAISYKREPDGSEDFSYSQMETTNKTKLFSEPKGRTLTSQNVVSIYHCSFCYHQTPYRFNLKIHFKSCRQSGSIKYWECPKCSVTYTLEDLLDEHSIPEDQDIVDRHVFYCPACPLGSNETSQATILEKIHPSNKFLVCPRCKVKVIGINTFRKHLITEHDVTIVYRCEYCEYQTSESDCLREHKKTHAALIEMGLIQCSHCNVEFLTMREFKEHMKKVQWEKEWKESKQMEKKERDVGGAKTDFKSFDLSKLDEEKGYVEVLNDEDIRNIADTRKFLLQCTLCQYVNFSEARCQRHVKNKHRPSGYSVVKFEKYYENQLMGSIDIGSIKVSEEDEEQSTKELLKVLDWSQSEEEDIPETVVKDNADGSEVITVEMASDSEEENGDGLDVTKLDNEQNNKEGNNDAKKQITTGLACKGCTYKAKNNQHLLMHKQLLHGDVGQGNVFKCSQRLCTFTSTERKKFKKHLSRAHKFKMSTFYPTEIKCPDCVYTTNKPQYLTMHRTCAHKDTSLKNTSRLTSVRNAVTNNSTSECDLTPPKSDVQPKLQKEFKTNRPMSEYDTMSNRSGSGLTSKSDFKLQLKKGLRNVPKVIRTETCEYCGKKLNGTYQLAWHMFKSHGDKSALRKWRLKCKMCSFKHCSKLSCYRHGLRHKKRQVRFLKFYRGKLTGAIGFRYLHLPKTTSKKSLLQPNHKIQHLKIKEKTSNRKEVSKKMAENNKNHNKSDSKNKKDSFMFSDRPRTRSQHMKIRDLLYSGVTTVVKEEFEVANSEFLKLNKRSRSKRRKKGDKDESDESDDSSHNNNEEDEDSDDSTEYTEDSNRLKKQNTDLSTDILSINNKCIHPGCEYESDKGHLKKHCLIVHQYSKRALDPIFLKLNQYECRRCKFKTPTHREMSTHMAEGHEMKSGNSEYISVCQKCQIVYRDRYQQAAHMYRTHGDKNALLKWRLCCSLCNYETHLTKYAYKHGMSKHSSTTEAVVVKFKKMYQGEFGGTYACRFGIRTLHHCDMCDFITGTWECLYKHIERHKRPGFMPQYRHKKETKDVAKGQKRVKKAARGRKKVKKETDSVVEVSQTVPVAESYSKEQIMDIIGLNIPEIKEIKDDLEKMVDEPNQEHKEENNEVITIQVISENVDTEVKKSTGTGILNPFTGEFIMESEDEDQFSGLEDVVENTTETFLEATKSFKCTQAGCKYFSDNLKKIADHIKSCTQNTSQRGKVIVKYTCHLCEEVLTVRDSLLKHSNVHANALSNPDLVVTFSELKNDTFACDIEIKANLDGEKAKSNVGPQQPAKISYKCWMCGVVLITKSTLENHTNIHAREDGNFNLKVRFSKFLDEKLEGTIIMHADPNYVPRKKRLANSPEPEYDPSRPVFSCNECNFRTNEKEALRTHKNLHWTAEKDALYKAKKWYTCSVCFFHCFDLKKFNDHCEWHKTHYTTAGGIKKLGKDSWFLK